MTTSGLNFRSRPLDNDKPLPVYLHQLPDALDNNCVNRNLPQAPTGMEKDEETELHLVEALNAQKAGQQASNALIPTPDVTRSGTNYNLRKVQISKDYVMEDMISFSNNNDSYDFDKDDEKFISQYNALLRNSRTTQLTVDKFEEMMTQLESAFFRVKDLDVGNELVKQKKVLPEVFNYWKIKRTSLKIGSFIIPVVKTFEKVMNHEPFVAFRKRLEKMQTRKNRKHDEERYYKAQWMHETVDSIIDSLDASKHRELIKHQLGINSHAYFIYDYLNHKSSSYDLNIDEDNEQTIFNIANIKNAVISLNQNVALSNDLRHKLWVKMVEVTNKMYNKINSRSNIVTNARNSCSRSLLTQTNCSVCNLNNSLMQNLNINSNDDSRGRNSTCLSYDRTIQNSNNHFSNSQNLNLTKRRISKDQSSNIADYHTSNIPGYEKTPVFANRPYYKCSEIFNNQPISINNYDSNNQSVINRTPDSRIQSVFFKRPVCKHNSVSESQNTSNNCSVSHNQSFFSSQPVFNNKQILSNEKNTHSSSNHQPNNSNEQVLRNMRTVKNGLTYDPNCTSKVQNKNLLININQNHSGMNVNVTDNKTDSTESVSKPKNSNALNQLNLYNNNKNDNLNSQDGKNSNIFTSRNIQTVNTLRNKNKTAKKKLNVIENRSGNVVMKNALKHSSYNGLPDPARAKGEDEKSNSFFSLGFNNINEPVGRLYVTRRDSLENENLTKNDKLFFFPKEQTDIIINNCESVTDNRILYNNSSSVSNCDKVNSVPVVLSSLLKKEYGTNSIASNLVQLNSKEEMTTISTQTAKLEELDTKNIMELNVQLDTKLEKSKLSENPYQSNTGYSLQKSNEKHVHFNTNFDTKIALTSCGNSNILNNDNSLSNTNYIQSSIKRESQINSHGTLYSTYEKPSNLIVTDNVKSTITEINKASDTNQNSFQSCYVGRSSFHSSSADKNLINSSCKNTDASQAYNTLDGLTPLSNMTTKSIQPSILNKNSSQSSSADTYTCEQLNPASNTIPPIGFDNTSFQTPSVCANSFQIAHSNKLFHSVNIINSSFQPPGDCEDSFQISGPNNNSCQPINPNNNLCQPVNPNNNSFQPINSNKPCQPIKTNNNSFQPINPNNNSCQSINPTNNSFQSIHSKNNVCQPIDPNNDSCQLINPNNDSCQLINPNNDSCQLINPNNNSFQPVNPNNNSCQSINSNNYSCQPINPNNNSYQPVNFTLSTLKSFNPNMNTGETVNSNHINNLNAFQPEAMNGCYFNVGYDGNSSFDSNGTFKSDSTNIDDSQLKILLNSVLKQKIEEANSKTTYDEQLTRNNQPPPIRKNKNPRNFPYIQIPPDELGNLMRNFPNYQSNSSGPSYVPLNQRPPLEYESRDELVRNTYYATNMMRNDFRGERLNYLSGNLMKSDGFRFTDNNYNGENIFTMINDLNQSNMTRSNCMPVNEMAAGVSGSFRSENINGCRKNFDNELIPSGNQKNSFKRPSPTVNSDYKRPKNHSYYDSSNMFSSPYKQ